jgi:autotransporter-associated beta strand protein
MTTKLTTSLSKFFTVATIAAAFAFGIERTRALDGTWTATAGGFWSAPGNWAGGNVADGADGSASTAFFNTLDITADVTVSLDTARTNGNMVFADVDTNTPANWIIAGTLPLTLGGATPTITATNIAFGDSVTIGCPLIGTNGHAPSGLTILGNGDGSLVKLTAVNIYTNTLVNAGSVGQSVVQSLGVNVTNNVVTLTNGGQVVRTAGITVNQGLNVVGPGTNYYSHVVGAGGNWNGFITGNGTLLMNLTNIQLTTGGNTAWNSNMYAGFTGTIILTGGGNLRFDINNASTTRFGSKFATFDLGTTNNTLNERAATGIAVHTTFLGALRGGPLTAMSANGTTGTTNTFQIGDANLSTTFSGKINNPSVSTFTAIIKSGSGTLTLDNTNGYSGTTLIQNGTLALTPNGNIRNGISITIVSNATFDVSQGQTTGVATNDWSPQANQTLQGNGTIAGSVTATAGTISPGDLVNDGVLTITTNLTMNAGATNVFKAGGGSNDELVVQGNLTLAGGTVLVLPQSGQSVIPNGTYPLFAWGGTLTGDTNNIVLTFNAQPGTLTLKTNLVTKQIVLTVAGASVNNLVWNGDGSANVWDHSALNWLSGATHVAFTELDNVTFNDSGSVNPPVNLVDVVNPSTVVFNTTNVNYKLTSTGGEISGLTGLTKNGPGTAVLDENNNYSGATTINGGTLQVGNNDTSGSLGSGAVVNNGTLVYDRTDTITLGSPLNGSGTLVQNGTNGTLILTGNSVNSGTIAVNAGTLQLGDGTSINGSATSMISNNAGGTTRYFYNNDATIANTLSGGGTVRYDLSTGNHTYTIPVSTVNSNFAGTNVINSGVRLHASDGNAGYILGNGSTVDATAAGSQIWLDRSATNYFTSFILSGIGWTGDTTALGSMRIFNCNVVGPVTLAADTRIGGSINGGQISGPIIGGSSQLEILGNSNSFILVLSNSANTWGNTLITSGALRAATPGAISTNNMTIDLAGELDVFGNTVKVSGLSDGSLGAGVVYNMSTVTNGTLVVGSDATTLQFDGTFGDGSTKPLNVTKVGTGTLTLTQASTNTGVVSVNGGSLLLSGSGSFNNASVIAAGSGGIYDVTGTGGPLTLNSGQTLKGSGSVNGNVIASAGSTINPGDTVGKLTITGTATLSGTLLMELNRTNASATNDSLVATGGITAGGTLTVTNVGPALHQGDTFKLFAGGLSGFSQVNLQTVDTANNVTYTWNNAIGSSGSISVASVSGSVNTNPAPISITNNAGNLTLSWPADHTGWYLQSQTNLAGTNWASIPGSSTTNLVIIPIATTNKSVFFRMVFTNGP